MFNFTDERNENSNYTEKPIIRSLRKFIKPYTYFAYLIIKVYQRNEKTRH